MTSFFDTTAQAMQVLSLPESDCNYYDRVSSWSRQHAHVDNSYEQRLQTLLAEIIAQVRQVDYIFCQREAKTYLVWVLINELDPQVRREIYTKQQDIMKMFPSEIFDFYVVARMNQPPETVINQRGMELIYSR